MSVAFDGVTLSCDGVVAIKSTLTEGATVGGDQMVPADSANPGSVSAPVVEVRQRERTDIQDLDPLQPRPALCLEKRGHPETGRDLQAHDGAEVHE